MPAVCDCGISWSYSMFKGSYMGFVTRKPDLVSYVQQMRRPACAPAQSDQCLCPFVIHFMQNIISKLTSYKKSIF